MAAIRKRGELQWQARVTRKGFPAQSKTFLSRSDAEAWARAIESEMDRGIFVSRVEAENTSLAEALDRYKREITLHKRGKAQESTLIDRWKKDTLASRSLASLRGTDFAKYRDRRKEKSKSSNTIRIELSLIGHLFETARREWGMEGLLNPIRNIRMPSGSKCRERRLARGEREAILSIIRSEGRNPWMEAAFVLALETGLRRSMLLKLRWEWVDLNRSVISIPAELRETENKGVPIGIPIWPEAHVLLSCLPRSIDGLVLPISPNALSCCWKRLQNNEKATILKDLRWHDLRHEATSRLFEKGLNPIEVQSITGHKSMQMLKRYTHIRPENLLAKYDGVRMTEINQNSK
jgi:integrase